jgi:hypothetical protein
MAKPPKKTKSDELELEPDAWPRFEWFIKAAAKAGPQHREAKPKPKPAARRKKTPAK